MTLIEKNIRRKYPVDRDSVLRLQDVLHFSLTLSLQMSQLLLWMFPFRHKLSICLNIYKQNTNFLFCLLPMTLQLYDISVIKLVCSIMENWWRLLLRKSCLKIQFILIPNHCCQRSLHRIQEKKKIRCWFHSMELLLQAKEK